MADLFGTYAKRIKISIDHLKIDSDLAWFPVTVILSSTHGDCIFDELTQDANRKKIAFTKSDGTTQLYGEIEKWDDATESAIIHVSLSGWSISSSADTDFYMYYDSSAADNTTYIGDIDSTPGHSVWDSDFKLVCHMVDATTSTIKDSTSNGNDGTKSAANEPLEVEGKVGKAQSFDGSNDWTTLSSIGLESSHQLTIENICRFPSASMPEGVIVEQSVNYNNNYACLWAMSAATTDKLRHGWSNSPSVYDLVEIDAVFSQDTDYIISTVYDTTLVGALNTCKSYVNGNSVAQTATHDLGTDRAFGDYDWFLGDRSGGGVAPCEYISSELRISNTDRSASWIKATYNSLWDTLLTYGDEEVSAAHRSSFFLMFPNF